MSIAHIYSGNPLDRAHRERHDEQRILAMVHDPTSRFLPVNDLQVPVSETPRNALGWMSADEWRGRGIAGVPLFLGRLNEVAFFAVDVSNQVQSVQDWLEGSGYRFVDARRAAEFLSGPDCGIVAQVRSHMDWHSRNGFCANCGHQTTVKRGGQARHCAHCGAEHYPHTDPVVIVVVSDGNRCLLGQSRGYLSRANRFSALAGFVDQGESIEEAVAREVMEEAGIGIENVRYHSSQPWPFPSSLMIGCHADAVTTDISIDDEEMASVRWFEREEVLSALEGKHGSLALPGPIAIAYHLIRAWATGEGGKRLSPRRRARTQEPPLESA